MAILLFLLAIAGGVLVGDLVLENTDPGSVTVLDRTFTGYTQGQLLAAVAALGLVIGALVVASLSLRKSRRVRVRELRQTRSPSWSARTGACGASCPAATRGNDVRPRPACRPTAPPTRSTTSPGGRPASAATWSPDRLSPAWEPRPDSAPASP
jgi:uncharacterized membrane protein YciS (DUF1049 family)